VLYPELTDKLVNTQQWRWQNKIVSLPAEAYLDEKRQATAWVTGILPEVKRLSRALAPQHQEMFIKGYDILGALAHGMELFVETAEVHHQWARAQTLDDAQAKARFCDLAARWESLAAQVPENPLLYHQRMLAWAEFLRNSLPRISNPQHTAKQ